MSEIPKAYEPQAVEEKWYAYWLKHNCFVADPASAKPAYSIVIPPPNVTGMLHMGHVLNNTIQDILARKARMDGKEVLWLPGTDHAGIATQAVVEKTLRKQGVMKHRDDLGREKFLEHVWAWKEKHGGIIIQQLKKVVLTDYKVRILESSTGTGARTRVLIQSTDGKREWGTVGVNDNIIEASLQALVDSMEYALAQR